jgi:signal transduction histidine kinase
MRRVHLEVGVGLLLAVAATRFVRDALLETACPDWAVLPVALLLAACQTAPLLLRRARPLAAWVILLATCLLIWGTESALGLHLGRTTAVANVVGLAVLYQVGRAMPRAVAAGVAVATAVAVLAARPAPGGVLLMILLVGASVLVGAVMSARLAAEARLAQERRVQAGLAERARIARELHDIVAHHMSVVALQAESAPHRLPALPEPAVREFVSIADGARAALDEMRQLLHTLRGEEGPERRPQPDLSTVEELVESVRRTGLPAELAVTGTLDDLPALCSTSAYRIVQEGLSNVVKHAPGATTSVRLTASPRLLEVEVRNGPPATPAPGRPGAEHGLRGVRERVELLSGTLRTGATEDGGFRLRAVLPAGKRRR